MAISLLGKMSVAPGGMSRVPTVGMDTPNGPVQVPVGVKAKNPTASVPGPSTSLPASQKSPVQPYASAPLGNSNADVLASSTTAAQNAAKAIGGTYTQGVGYTPGSSSTGNTPNNPGSLYSAYVNSLGGGLQNSQNNQNAQNYTKQISTAGKGNLDVGQSAADIAANYGKQIADVGRRGAAFESGQRTTGTSPVAQGNAAITAQTTAAQQQALATGEAAALAGTGQQLTAQQQAANAANQAAGQAYTGQSQQLGALQQAAGYAQPNLGSIGQVPYSPVDFSQGAILGSTQPGGLNAAGNLLGQYQGAQALGAAQGTGQAQGIQAVGAAPGQAQASNIQTGATAGVNANQSVLNPAYNNYLQLQQTTQNIDGFGSLLTQTMQQGGINPSDVKYANAKLADIRNALSSQQQAIYDNTLAGLRSRVSGLLAAGGSEIPTQITADATKILDGTLPLSALSGVLQRIQAEGNVLLGNAANVVNTAYSGTQGTNQSNSSNGSVSGFGWNG